MGPKLYTAVRLYVDGLRDGHWSAALDKYVVDDLVQHTDGLGPGRAGLAEAFAGAVARHERRTVRPLRGFEDGSRVFLHTFHSYGHRAAERVTIDVFDTDTDDHLIEHWSVTADLAGCSRSGYSQIDGPTVARDHGATEENKALVAAYADDVLAGGRADRIRRYLSAATFTQHSPEMAGGWQGYARYLDGLEEAGTPLRYTRVDLLIGSGDLVALGGRCVVGAREFAVADLFRIEAGRIVEHWDVRRPVGTGLV